LKAIYGGEFFFFLAADELSKAHAAFTALGGSVRMKSLSPDTDPRFFPLNSQPRK
jgi:hypothetical protein